MTEFDALTFGDPFDTTLFEYSLSTPSESTFTIEPTQEQCSFESVSLQLDLSTHLLNRSQWYTLLCKFSTPEGNAAFVGRSVAIDPSIAFMDSRKRFTVTKTDNNNDIPLVLNMVGVCSLNGRTLLKCKKCKDQDKVKINRKRKRDSEGWSEIDQYNNSKLLQVLETGCHKVGEDGILSLRFRVQCCVGASRQFHRNHGNNEIPNNNNPYENSNEEVHKGCEGFSLSTIVKMNSSEISYFMKDPIRVVGKVTKCCTKPTYTTPQPMLQSQSGLTVYNIPIISTQTNTTKVASTTDPISVNQLQNQVISKTLTCYSQTKPNTDNGWHIYQLYSILRKNLNDSTSLRKLAMIYLRRVDSRFQFSCRSLFDRDFFRLSNLLQIPRESTLMLIVYHSLSVGYIINKNGFGKKKDKLMSLTEELAFQLTLKLPIMHLPDNELLNLADTFNRISISHAIIGKIANAKFFVNEASKIFDHLNSYQPSIISTPSYELLLWNKSCFHIQLDNLQQDIEKFVTPLNIVLFQNINNQCKGDPCDNPLIMDSLDGPFKAVYPPLETSKKEHIMSLCDILEITLSKSNFELQKDPITGSVISTSTSMTKVMHLAVTALRHWINTDIMAATKAIEDCALHASAAKTQELDYSPIELAAFVAVQLVAFYIGMDDPERGSGTESQSHEEEGTEDGFLGERGRSWEERRSRSILVAEIFLKYPMSRTSPWGTILDRFNMTVFQKLLKIYQGVGK